MDLISIVVPCYNEEEALPPFYQAVTALAKTMPQVEFEFILVNDGSRDRTLEVMRTLASQDDRIHYLSFSRNFGKEAAMLAGFERSRGDYVAIMDADLQDPPQLIAQMYDSLQREDYDCVASYRSTRTGEPKLRSLFANLFYRLMGMISDTEIVNGARDFRLMTRQMVNAIIGMQEYHRFSKGLFGFVGFRTKWIPYENVERVAGQTSWSFWGLCKYSLEGIVAFSTKPLHLSSILGFLLCVCSFLFVCYTVVRTLIWGDPVDGYPTLICMITFLGGIQLFSIGILGQYIAKMYTEIKRRPIYIIKEESESRGAK